MEEKYQNIANRVINNNLKAIESLYNIINNDVKFIKNAKEFVAYVNNMKSNKGRVIFTAIGKSGIIARKITASFISNGIPALFMHAAEASHGDMGMIQPNDIVVILSNSGKTEELLNIINYCKNNNIEIAAITMNKDSYLAQNSKFLFQIPNCQEASQIKAPTTSALLTLLIGDILTIILQETNLFTKKDFALLHPGGNLGKILINS